VGWEGEALPAPRNYTNRNSFDALAGEEMPKVVVISPGLWDIPTHPENDGYYAATWQVGVGIAIAGRTEEEADRTVKMYGAAARAIVVQHQSLESSTLGVCGVSWLDENYDDLPLEDQFMNYKSVGIFLGVEVEDAVNRFTRPPRVTEAPQTLGTVETVITEFPDVPLTVTTEPEP
jgi:hypothetical protein